MSVLPDPRTQVRPLVRWMTCALLPSLVRMSIAIGNPATDHCPHYLSATVHLQPWMMPNGWVTSTNGHNLCQNPAPSS